MIMFSPVSADFPQSFPRTPSATNPQGGSRSLGVCLIVGIIGLFIVTNRKK